MSDVTTGTGTDWRAVWRAVDQERRERRWSLPRLYAATSVSETTYRKMQNGTPMQRPDKIGAMLDALGWLEGSIESISAGHGPIRRNEETGSELYEALVHEVRRLAVEVEAMRRLIDPGESSSP
jgi:hypothetical protein